MIACHYSSELNLMLGCRVRASIKGRVVIGTLRMGDARYTRCPYRIIDDNGTGWGFYKTSMDWIERTTE